METGVQRLPGTMRMSRVLDRIVTNSAVSYRVNRIEYTHFHKLVKRIIRVPDHLSSYPSTHLRTLIVMAASEMASS